MALIDGVAASLVLPVEIRLALEKAMQVELLTGFAPCPRATVNETSSPVGRRHRETVYSDDVAVLVFLRVVPNVLVGLGVVSTLCSAVCTATSTRGQRIRRLVCRPTLSLAVRFDNACNDCALLIPIECAACEISAASARLKLRFRCAWWRMLSIAL
jgi:hypothetical protein